MGRSYVFVSVKRTKEPLAKGCRENDKSFWVFVENVEEVAETSRAPQAPRKEVRPPQDGRDDVHSMGRTIGGVATEGVSVRTRLS